MSPNVILYVRNWLAETDVLKKLCLGGHTCIVWALGKPWYGDGAGEPLTVDGLALLEFTYIHVPNQSLRILFRQPLSLRKSCICTNMNDLWHEGQALYVIYDSCLR